MQACRFLCTPPPNRTFVSQQLCSWMNLYTSLIFILTSAVLCVRIKSREKSWFKLNTTISNRASGDSRYDWATKRRTKPDLTWTFCVLSLQDNCVCLIRRLFYLPDCFVRWLRASSSLDEERSSFCFLKNFFERGWWKWFSHCLLSRRGYKQQSA